MLFSFLENYLLRASDQSLQRDVNDNDFLRLLLFSSTSSLNNYLEVFFFFLFKFQSSSFASSLSFYHENCFEMAWCLKFLFKFNNFKQKLLLLLSALKQFRLPVLANDV